MYYCIDDNEELIEAPEAFISRRRTKAKTLEVADKKEYETYMMVLLFKPKQCGVGTIAHEADHVVNFVAEWLGFLPRRASEDESHAYLIQWVSNCIWCTLGGHPEKMKGVKVE